jgi:amino acid transporter
MAAGGATERTLKKNEVGILVGISTTAGLVVGQLTFVTMGFGIGTMGPAFLVAMLTALVIAYFQVFSFSELSTMYPRAGSIFEYVSAGLGPVLGTMAAFAGYIMIAIFSGSAELSVAGILIQDELIGGTNWWIWALLMAALLAAINIVGVRWYGAFDVAITAILVAMMVVVGLVGLAGLGTGDPVTGWAESSWPSFGTFASFVALAFFLYIGFEYVCPLAEEMRNARRNIPLAMAIGLAMVFVGHALFGLAASRWVPLGDLAGSAVPHVLFADTIFGSGGKWVIGAIGLTASLSSMNSLYAAAPRILYGMGKDGFLPKIFSWVHPSFRTPTFSIVFIAALSVIPLAAGTSSRTVLLLILGSVFAWIAAYVLIHLSVISLRLRAPAHERPFRSPLFPVPQVLGIAALIYMITKISPDPTLTNDVYIYGGSLLAAGAVFSIGWELLKQRRLRIGPMDPETMAAQPDDSAAAPRLESP